MFGQLSSSMDKKSERAVLPYIIQEPQLSVSTMRDFRTVAPRYSPLELCDHLRVQQATLTASAGANKTSAVFKRVENQLRSEIERGEYVGPGAGRLQLPDGTVDPLDITGGEHFCQVLM